MSININNSKSLLITYLLCNCHKYSFLLHSYLRFFGLVTLVFRLPFVVGDFKQYFCSIENVVIPSVSNDVLRTASLRHQKGLMVPTILHVLSTQEVRLPCLMEDESNRELPPIYDIYLPLRQRVYAVLFNLHHLRYVHSKKKGVC